MIEQVIIAITGVAAVWLSQESNLFLRKHACIFGLLGQPFWFYAAYSTEQWGIFILCFFYTLAWMKGFKGYWM